MEEERKSVLITGGSRGIGKQIALRFAKEGYNIAINYVSDNTNIQELEQELKIQNSNILLHEIIIKRLLTTCFLYVSMYDKLNKVN